MKEWGVKGEVKARPLSNKFSLLKHESLVYLSGPGGTFQKQIIQKIKFINRHAVIAFQGVTDPETAAGYKGFLLLIPQAAVRLENGEFFYEQIIGLSVITTTGLALGKVVDILQTGSNDVYVVKDDDKEYLIPAIADVIKKIDIEEKRILIEAMDGLLD